MPDAKAPQLWHMPCPCSESHQGNPHSPSAHPLISSAQTQTLQGTFLNRLGFLIYSSANSMLNIN